jgi:hypothetical protein
MISTYPFPSDLDTAGGGKVQGRSGPTLLDAALALHRKCNGW